MKNSAFGKVTVKVSDNKKKGKFNLSHDNNTSFDWGSVQPVLSQLMLPDSSINVNMEQLTRLAPMPVPTFGRVKMKNVVHFVSIKDIFPNFEYFLAKKPISRPTGSSVNTFTPNQLPHVNSSLLTAFALAGAKFNLWIGGLVGTPEEYHWTCPTALNPNLSDVDGLANYLFGSIGGNAFIGRPNTSITGLNYTGYAVSIWKFTKGSSSKSLCMNDTGDDFFAVPAITTKTTVLIDSGSGIANGFTHAFDRSGYTNTSTGESRAADAPVTFDGADLIWESIIDSARRASSSGSVWSGFGSSAFDGRRIRITIQLSSFGKRLHKMLVGLGYNFSLNDDSEVCILPLLAAYKAYWDSYAPERVRNFYQTSAWRLIQLLCDGNVQCSMTSFMEDSTLGANMRLFFKQFIFELGSLFATDRMDVISAATEEMIDTQSAVSADVYGQIHAVMKDYFDNVSASGFAPFDLEVQDKVIPNISRLFPVLEASNSVPSPMLSQPQLDALKAAYTYVNKYSVAGQNLADILRMNGLGKYVEECQGKFVAASEDTIKISDVVATAGTTDAKLGQYGGRGLGASADQFSFSTDRHGYLIMLSSIVPESGYVNSPDLTLEAVDRDNFFEEEFDGFNYEALTKKQLAGSKQIMDCEDTSCNSTYGYLPTFTNWKFKCNIANGDFSLFSRKNSTRPYTLDKHIPVDEVNVVSTASDTIGDYCRTTPTFKYSDLPNAGEDYRYLAKMPWNGDYNRIFTAEDDGLEWQVMSNAANSDGYLYNSFEYDNFQTHFIFSVTYWAPMKEIEDSYSTFDDEDVSARGGISRS